MRTSPVDLHSETHTVLEDLSIQSCLVSRTHGVPLDVGKQGSAVLTLMGEVLLISSLTGEKVLTGEVLTGEVLTVEVLTTGTPQSGPDQTS